MYDGSFTTKGNSQVENTPAVIYSLDESRRLKWQKRYRQKISDKYNKWETDETFKASFTLDSDSVCIINLDEKPLGKTNIDEGYQYQHEGVRVSGEIMSVTLVFRVVNTSNLYDCKDDIMVLDPDCHKSAIINYCLGRDMYIYYKKILKLYHNVLY